MEEDGPASVESADDELASNRAEEHENEEDSSYDDSDEDGDDGGEGRSRSMSVCVTSELMDSFLWAKGARSFA
jgi:hypothetical protein